MRWGMRIGAVVVALLLQAQVAQAAELKLGMVFKYLTNLPEVTVPVDNAAPSLDTMALELDWDNVQTSCDVIRRGEFDWALTDEAMDVARSTGVPVTLTLLGGPKCTSPGPGLEPKGKWVKEYATFAGQVARRYGNDPVAVIEIWSEPNLHRTFDGNADDYQDIFLAAEKKIRRADSGVKSLVGGLGFCCGPQRFVKQLYESKAMRRRGKHLGAHTYSPKPKIAIERLKLVRKNAPKKIDIWITEHGWSTCPDPTNQSAQKKCVPPSKQARQMKDYIRLLRANQRKLDVRALYWFQAMDFSTPEQVADCPNSPKHFYGIWRYDGTAKPSHAVWSDATSTVLPETVPSNPAAPRLCRD